MAFAAGDVCLLFDNKGRRYLLTLRPGSEFQYHHGMLRHDDIIGSDSGTRFSSSKGSPLVALQPRLADYVLTMKRGATVVYPKDAAAMMMWGDVGPGMRVVEAGTGSGALTMALVRSVGDTGHVTSVDTRQDHSDRAAQLISAFFGGLPEQLTLVVGRVEDELAIRNPDRVLLDLPEPWHCVPIAAEQLRPGGVFTCYLPTVPQVQEVRDAMAASRRFHDVETFEVLQRGWEVEGRSVRPSHRMQGHTGFITVGRVVAPLA
jgi:tRNA (adenine57-N1/adenine58-N1)-methyltransferase